MQTEKLTNKKPSLTLQQSHNGIVPFAIGSALIALFIFAYYIFTWRNFFNFQAAIDTCTKPLCDFATFYYPMGEAVFHTRAPLDGFVYSPFIAILLAVFSPLGINAALVLWGTLQAIFIIFYLLLFRQLVPANLPIQLLFVALLLSSFPLLHTLTWGQVSIFTTVAILGALLLYERGQLVAAAALFAFAVSFKFFPIIFLMPFVFRRDTRFLLFAVAACGIFLFFVPSTLLGVGDMLDFYSGLINAYRSFDWVVINYNSQHFPHVFIRLAETLGTNACTLLPILRWITYGIASINMGLVYLVQRARLRLANLWSFHIIFLSIPFFLKTSWPVDLVYIPFAQTLLAWQFLERNGGTQGKQSLPKLTVEKFLLLISIFISNIVFFNFIGDHFSYGFYGFIFWTNLLLLVASYVVLLPPSFRKAKRKWNKKPFFLYS